MLLFFIIFTLIAVSGVLLTLRRKRQRRLLQTENYRPFNEPPTARSLFEPTDEDLRAFKRAEDERLRAKKAEEIRLLEEAKITRGREYEAVWHASPDVQKTGELIRLAAESENALFFSEISQTVIKLWREKGIENLSARDLTELLNSHFRLLPQQERISGAMFRLKEEIADLRSQSEE